MFALALLATASLTPIDIDNDPACRFGYDKPLPGFKHPARIEYHRAIAWRNEVCNAGNDIYSWYGREPQLRLLLLDAQWRVQVWDAFDAAVKLREKIGYVMYYLSELPTPYLPSDE